MYLVKEFDKTTGNFIGETWFHYFKFLYEMIHESSHVDFKVFRISCDEIGNIQEYEISAEECICCMKEVMKVNVNEGNYV